MSEWAFENDIKEEEQFYDVIYIAIAQIQETTVKEYYDKEEEDLFW